MPDSVPGLYEALITERLTSDLSVIGEGLHVVRDELRHPEAPDRIALHLGRVVERAVQRFNSNERAHQGAALAQQIIELIRTFTGDETVLRDRPVAPGQVLRAIQRVMPDGQPATLHEPQTPLLDTTLLTNAPSEPRVGAQILSEIDSADRIDVIMAFVRMSGIRPLLQALRRHCESNRILRVLTTTYTGSTELTALQELERIGAHVRVSYDTSGTRLHAKSWLFHRTSGYSTAYVGSSNLTHQAQVTGLEWNVRISGVRNPDVTRQIEAIFESYWNNQDFRPFESVQFLENTRAARTANYSISIPPTELRPEPFQTRLL